MATRGCLKQPQKRNSKEAGVSYVMTESRSAAALPAGALGVSCTLT